MSRIGRQPIAIPTGVKIFLRDSTVKVEGPLGKIEQTLHPDIVIQVDDAKKQVNVARPTEGKLHRSLHGLVRTLVANMVQGVTQGFQKDLDIEGVGYNAKLQGRELVLSVGFANSIFMKIPEGLKVDLPSATHITVKGCDKQAVGQFAASVRRIKPPDPYRAKGIRYTGEVIKRKQGKKFGTAE